MGDWFQVVEQSNYRRSTLLAEARREQRCAAFGQGNFRAQLAAALIRVALWLAPATAQPRRQGEVLDERILPGIVGS
ncbi:MAG TPA: hypothetical protein VIL85_18410 [Thermomicrobiales bacterium]|jgi:hypothetical protein